ncbi:MAG: pirin family protein [Bdellovibrionaceae bacterium]|nr:pirin family protein [Pseudobdellovibrionaceae bacterium]
MKKLLSTQRSETPHWVGDGFPVRTIFSYNDLGREISPFLLMDYAGPTEFPPSRHIRGVGEHPHRGFETVTIVYEGEVEHRDSSGGGGLIGPGDVQWMTAASGLVHEEKHGAEFAKKGGQFEMVQLWVNLPAKDKMTKPKYQGLRNAQIPQVTLDGDAGTLRVIAGEFQGAKGPAATFTPIELWDVRAKKDRDLKLSLPEGHTVSVFVLSGEIETLDGRKLSDAEIGVFERESTELAFKATQDTKLLILAGKPLGEPVVGYGPFVMNSMMEIRQAFDDFNAGRMGQLGEIEGSES